MHFSRAGATVGRLAGALGASVLDVLYPESCLVCGVAGHRAHWCGTGPPAPGLRPFDRPHLCRDCQRRLAADGPVGWAADPGAGVDHPHLGACPTTGELTALVGAWKYHGVRGVAWPLAELLTGVLTAARQQGLDPGILVPVPLHRRRRRGRGFNQAAVLAHLAGQALDLPVDEASVRRTRATGQQARLRGAQERLANMSGVFVARPPAAGVPRRVTLVDDVVTSGATTGELARALARVGWEVVLVAALGLAHRDGLPTADAEGAGVPVDTLDTPT